MRELAAVYAKKLRDAQILRDSKECAEAVGARPIYLLGEVKKPGQ